MSPARATWREWLSRYGIALAFLALVLALALLSPGDVQVCLHVVPAWNQPQGY